MTTNGLIQRETFQALWDAHDGGLRIVVVTGRPAGWCDHIARQWPVDGVIGENGAFYFRKVKNAIRRVYAQSAEERAAHRRRLNEVRDQILRAVPGAAVATDQAWREADLAIDYCESVRRLPDSAIRTIVGLFHAAGAQTKVSSIHVNGWFGSFDKCTMALRYIIETTGRPFEAHPLDFAFVGDSPNDEPLWALFPRSFAVANVAPWMPRLCHAPATTVTRAGGAGFAQVVGLLLAEMARQPDHSNEPFSERTSEGY